MKPVSLAAALVLFSCASLFASADLVLTIETPNTAVRAGRASVIYFNVRNNGPDVAPAVTVAASSSVPTSCFCNFGNMQSGETRTGNVSFDTPNTNTMLSFSFTASSGATDPNPANNAGSASVTVSTDPDVSLSLNAPVTQELGLPFLVTIFLANNSNTTAHDLETTIDFRTDLAVKSLPDGCSTIATGRVLCRLDSLPPTTPAVPAFALSLVAPTSRGFASATFTAIVTEREHDFDPISNTNTAATVLYKTFFVSTTANEGGGSLRQAIADANTECLGSDPCEISFRIDQASPNRWKTIRITTPLPALTGINVRIDGGTQARFFGDTNPDGPDVEISAQGTVDGDGLVVTNCATEVATLVINGFQRNGISVTQPSTTATCRFNGALLHQLFLGTDPSGTVARPNARGIGTSFVNGVSINSVGTAATIRDNVISGNLHAGIFGLSGRLNIARNRIGVKAHSDDPLPNGNAGVFIGPGGYGSDVGVSSLSAGLGAPNTGTPDLDGNVIAFNGQMGVAVSPGVADVAIRQNHIWGNALLGIDIGLDGPTQQSPTTIPMPSLTLAFYDPVTKQTVIDGDVSATNPASTFSAAVDFFANDAPDPTGLGEGQRPIGSIAVPNPMPAHFRFTVDGDLTGKFISATLTRIEYVGFAKPAGIEQLYLSQTSELSPVIEVR